jgi:flagellar hook-associated protein FlgK
MMLTFYIRGASSDYILTMDQKLIAKLWEWSSQWSLLTQSNKVLKKCKDSLACSDENKISDIINLLNSAKTTYKGIRDADKNSSPITIVTRRSDLMSTVTSLEKKLQQIEGKQSDNIVQQ